MINIQKEQNMGIFFQNRHFQNLTKKNFVYFFKLSNRTLMAGHLSYFQMLAPLHVFESKRANFSDISTSCEIPVYVLVSRYNFLEPA